ncbi:winged helix-turn-helix domain-containing protein [Pseudoalteromonas sp. NEC-BIFX-2020_015]|uniref:winged helix-turn-helix domain-containing protein n=1 Tax=Pseudoalteromonas sp. NEC-BIFX-2020_015 TaxID=2729544 RepID=UPI0024AF810B|nr:winged helix-turn-helix domain-containing protein [Pseudoalteromonas sp. NEC-BIFX-2020_015]
MGDWLIDADGLSIQNKHLNKDLDSKVMQLLVYLVDNRERVVTRNELLDQLWANQIVADDVLNVAMSSLRKALGDDFKTPTYIKTLPRKGYQLIAPVKTILANRQSIKLYWLITTLFVLMIALLLWFKFKPVAVISDSNQPIRLAVLPFDYYSSIRNREYIADGLTEAIINQLVQESALQVTSRASVMQYKVKKASIKEVVEQLNVEWILEGSVQLEGDKILVTAQLINAVEDVHIWSETYQRNLSDLFKIQTEFASEIVTRLNLSSKQATINNNKSTLRKIPPAAYDRFLQAQFFQYQGESEKAINAYKQSIDLYPDYAQAYAHLSHSYFSKAYSEGKQAGELIDKASKLAFKALQIDPNPAYVQLAIALTYLYKDYDYQAAGKAFKLAFKRNNQDLMILEWFAEYLLITKQFDKAEQLAKHMVASSPLAYNKDTTYRALYYSGDFKGADKEVANKAMIISEGYRESLYAWNSLASGNHDSLLSHAPLFLKELKVQQNIIDEFLASLKDKGLRNALNFIVENTPAFNNYDRAKFYAWAGENKKAILLLKTLVAERNLQVLKLGIEPAFKLLTDEPDYIALLKQLKQ